MSNLAMAHEMKKRAHKPSQSNEKLDPEHEPHVEDMAQKVMSHPDSSKIVKAIMEKHKMCGGGEVESYSGGGEVELDHLSMSGDDLLSDDQDMAENMSSGGEVSDKKKRLSDIMNRIQMSHMSKKKD